MLLGKPDAALGKEKAFGLGRENAPQTGNQMLPQVQLETTVRCHVRPLGWLLSKDQKASVARMRGRWTPRALLGGHEMVLPRWKALR